MSCEVRPEALFKMDRKKAYVVERDDFTNPNSAAYAAVEEEFLQKTFRYDQFMDISPKKVAVLSCKFEGMEDTLKQLEKGASLHKVRAVNRIYPRKFKVDVEAMMILVESKKWLRSGGYSNSSEDLSVADALAKLSCVSSQHEDHTKFDSLYPSKVALKDVTEIRDGWKTDAFNNIEKAVKAGDATELPVQEECCFSIIYGTNGHCTLDLMASTELERDAWTSGLRHLLETHRSLDQNYQYDLWLRSKFEAADKDKNGALNMDEVVKLLSDLNLKLERAHIKKLFSEANTNSTKRDGEQVLDSQEFVSFYHSLLRMPVVEELFKKYGTPARGTLSTSQLQEFFKVEQGSELSADEAKAIVQKHELSNTKHSDMLTLDGFYHLLLSDLLSAYNYEHQKTVNQSMNEPLAHYFISSSHNTYLTGNQLTGESSVEGYVSALKRGCRVVELDLWDGDDGEPIIYHGRTLTSKITLADVLKDAIKPYAFYMSPYPVILSIENHLSVPQQKVMVRQFKEILKDLLMTTPVDKDLKELPSPHQLKNKIIVKAKKPQGTEVEDDDEIDDDQDQEPINYIDADDGAASSKPRKPIAPELAEVVNVCEGKKFSSFATSAASDECYHFPSLRENKAEELVRTSAEEFVKFTRKQIAKIYPLGTRTGSSNLKPYPYWSVGAQVVTLNMQTEDKPTFYNEALFRTNGNCGYVLKPDILRGLSPYNPDCLTSSTLKVLRVTILSGQHLPPSEKRGDVVDPFIQVKVRGHSDDKQKQRTKTVKNNGFNPVWNETLEMRIKVAPIALIYFTVRDESSMGRDAVLALACIPFRSLQTGYRHVHLTDMAGKPLKPSALFVKISIFDS